MAIKMSNQFSARMLKTYVTPTWFIILGALALIIIFLLLKIQSWLRRLPPDHQMQLKDHDSGV